jgi:hypothetical protein
VTKPATSLDLVQVASPCHVAWDEMTGDARQRFCRHCNQHVYNLSEMPRDEAEAFIAKAAGRTCVRIYRRADGTVLTRDCPVGLRAMRQRFVRAAAALAGLVAALVTGTLFAGRLKNVGADLRRPSETYAEWIEPGSTQMAVMGLVICRPVPQPPAPPATPGVTDLGAPESPLPEPTPEQLQEIQDRLSQ